MEHIIKQKQMEDEIRAYQGKLRFLASALSLTEERERRRLAIALHDRIGQILALIQIKLGWLREEVSSDSLVTALDRVRVLVEQVIQQTRSLTFELSPPFCPELGFGETMEWLATQIQDQYGIRVEVQKHQPPKSLTEEARILVFRVVRELLINVARHAHATQARISLGMEGRDLRIQVEDDGNGFEAVRIESQLGKVAGFGLFSIRERLDHIGGRLELKSHPGHGTLVTLMIPLKPSE